VAPVTNVRCFDAMSAVRSDKVSHHLLSNRSKSGLTGAASYILGIVHDPQDVAALQTLKIGR
jgi:hypothetical protein